MTRTLAGIAGWVRSWQHQTALVTSEEDGGIIRPYFTIINLREAGFRSYRSLAVRRNPRKKKRWDRLLYPRQ